MNQTDLISLLAEETDNTEAEVRTVIEALRATVASELAAGNAVTLTRFVKFTPKKIAAVKRGKRKNPFTGEVKMYPAKPAHTKAKVAALGSFHKLVAEGK